MAKKKKAMREKPIPEDKVKLVNEIAHKLQNSRTVFVASIKGLPASQFQKIKKRLNGKAEVVMAKKSILLRAISKINKGKLPEVKELIKADTCLMFSQLDAFQLASELIDNQSSAKAKAGDIAPEDIHIEAGPTDLLPGPAISELGSVGLKVAVENGKLSIRQAATIVKAGEPINAKVVSVLGKLNIAPMRVGFIPVGAYDAESDAIYTEIKIDKAGALEELRTAISKSLGFAVNINYIVKETIGYFISKAAMEEKALKRIYESKTNNQQDTREAQ
jgi:large subunit ribosomal protein L10